MKTANAMIATALLFTLSACEESADIPTNELRAEIDVVIHDDDADVNVILYHEQQTQHIPLTGGDELWVSTDVGDDVPLREGAGTSYEAIISAESRVVTLSLVRPDHDDTEIAVDVAELAVIENTTFSQQDEEITVTWSNPDEDADVTIFIDSCADFQFEGRETKAAIADEGSFTITKAELESEAGFTPDCARLQLLRRHYRNPTQTERFDRFSYISGRRYQDFEITLTP